MVKKKISRSRITPKLLLLAITLLMVIVLLYGWSSKTTNEKDNFMRLRADFKSLQAEFNKVDNGWKYDESCRALGGAYTSNVPSSCNIRIYNDTANIKAASLKSYQKILGNESWTTTEDYVNRYTINDPKKGELDGASIKFSPNYFKTSNCELTLYQSIDGSSSGVSCTMSAEDFYFRRSDV